MEQKTVEPSMWRTFARICGLRALFNLCKRMMKIRLSLARLRARIARQQARATSTTEQHPSEGQNHKRVRNPIQECYELLFKFFMLTLQPFSKLEEEFHSLNLTQNASSNLPKRKSSTEVLLSESFDHTQLDMMESLKNAASITLTIEQWKSVHNERYISVTAHFINNDYQRNSVFLEAARVFDRSKEMAVRLKQTVSEWGISEKQISLAITDGSHSIQKAVSEHLGWPHFQCYAHAMDAILRDALYQVKALLNTVKKIAHSVDTAVVIPDTLDRFHKLSNKEPKYLEPTNSVSWERLLRMLRRVYEHRDRVRATTQDEESRPELSDDDFGVIKQLIQIISLMEAAMGEVNEPRHTTASSIIVITSCLRKRYISMLHDGDRQTVGNRIVRDIVRGLSLSLLHLEKDEDLLISTFLDPRYKSVGFATQPVAERAQSLVMELLTSVDEDGSPPHDVHCETSKTSQCEESDADFVKKYTDNWTECFDRRAADHHRILDLRARGPTAVKKYLEEPLLDRGTCPLDWWKRNGQHHPELSKLVRKRFGAVGVCVLWERLSSDFGKWYGEVRKELSFDKVHIVPFDSAPNND